MYVAAVDMAVLLLGSPWNPQAALSLLKKIESNRSTFLASVTFDIFERGRKIW
jgi:hypothetical protein